MSDVIKRQERTEGSMAVVEREVQPPDDRLKLEPIKIDSEEGAIIETPRFNRANQLESLPIWWLWQDRIPLSKVTLLAGPADCGKSFAAVDMAARVSRGDYWPDQDPDDATEKAQEMGQVLYVCSGHDAEDTVHARLEQAGADMDNVHILAGMTRQRPYSRNSRQREFTFPEDFATLENALSKLEAARLVIIDSLPEFCPDRGREAKTIRLLNDLAARHVVPIVVISRVNGHCSPSGQFQGTFDRPNAPIRSALGMVVDEEDPDRTLFLPARMSYGIMVEGLAFRNEEGKLVWEPLGDLAAGRAARELITVTAWLRELLSKGPREGGKIQSQAKECGFSEATLRTAKRKLGIRVIKYGFSSEGHWLWWLPGAAGLETMEDLERFLDGIVREEGGRIVRRGPRDSDRRGSPDSAEGMARPGPQANGEGAANPERGRSGRPATTEDEPEEEIWTPVMYRASDRMTRRANPGVARLPAANPDTDDNETPEEELMQAAAGSEGQGTS